MSKLTIYNIEDNSYSTVEEPDSSLTYTYADYLQWKFEERLELFRGKILKLSAPNTRHQQICLNIGAAFHSFLKSKNCKAFISPFDVRLPVKNRSNDNEIITVVQPDVCVVCDESKIDSRGCCGAPDLIVEVLSPGNSKKEVRLKFELYEEAGVKEYWIAYPVEESIIVFRLNEAGKYAGGEVYATDDIIKSVAIEGFSVNLTDIFS